MQKSIAKNSIFYFIYNALNMLFPFISSMYVARILTPASIGDVAVAQNIVSYFSILAFLGIPTYGLREVAKYRDDKNELNKITSELFIINLISTIVFSAIYYSMILIVPKYRDSLALYMLVGITVLLNMLNIGWLYEGLEEFGYVSKRNAVFKLLMFVLLVVFVRNENDVLIYAGINVIGVAGNNLINIIHSRKYVNPAFKRLNLRRHMKSIILLVVVNLAIEIYTLVDTTMLGILSTNENVAYYTYGSRVNRILLQVTNTVTMVLVPRISYVYKEGNFKEFNRLLTRGLKAIVIFAIPMIIGIQFTAQFLFTKLYGQSYINSAYVEMILCFVLIVSPVGYLLGSRVMLVSGNEKKMILCVGAGAIVNIVGNAILIPMYQEYGAAIASVVSEIVVMIMYVNQGRRIFKLEKCGGALIKTCIASSVELIYLLLCSYIFETSWARLLIQIMGSIFVYGATLLILREDFTKEYFGIVIKKMRKS